MAVKIILLLELEVAHGAVKLPTLAVTFPVRLHSAGLGEALLADRTRVRPLTSMPTHVRAQRVVGGEALLADGAAVRLLSGVNPSMLAEVLRTLEVFAAEVTDEAAACVVS